MTRTELEQQYRVKGTWVVSPGKFEGEDIWAPYFWDIAMDGGAAEEWRGDGVVYTVGIDPEDLQQFPELAGFRSVELYEDGDGFVSCTVRS